MSCYTCCIFCTDEERDEKVALQLLVNLFSTKKHSDVICTIYEKVQVSIIIIMGKVNGMHELRILQGYRAIVVRGFVGGGIMSQSVILYNAPHTII